MALDMPNTKSGEGRSILQASYRDLAAALERVSGRTITAVSLQAGIETANRKRAALHRLAGLRRANPAPISGLDALLINQVSFYDDPVRFTASVEKLCDELEERIAARTGVAAADTPRLVISGCPMAVPNWKLPAIVESAGAVIVADATGTLHGGGAGRRTPRTAGSAPPTGPCRRHGHRPASVGAGPAAGPPWRRRSVR